MTTRRGTGRGTASAGARPGTAPRGVLPMRAHAAPVLDSPLSALAPMLATAATQLPTGDGWVFEPKYDGVRILAAVDGEHVALVTRGGHDTAPQFPEVRDALAALGRARHDAGIGPLVLDGELVARGRGAARRPAAKPPGPPHDLARFETLQGRLGLRGAAEVTRAAAAVPALLVAFDVLLDGDAVLVARPWRARRACLERALGDLPAAAAAGLRCSTVADGAEEGRALLARLERAGWEGVMAKRADAPYTPGRRSPTWRKLKLEHRQEFVIVGFTVQRTAAAGRTPLGALLLGYRDDRGRLAYAGRVGTGFTHAVARDLRARLGAIARDTSPLASAAGARASSGAGGRTAEERIQWVEPSLVVEVRFSEWTAAGRLRQPVYLGRRDDKAAAEVVREPRPLASLRHDAPRRAPAGRAPAIPGSDWSDEGATVVAQLLAIEAAGGNGVLRVPGTDGEPVSLAVTNLGKPLLPPLPAPPARRTARAAAADAPITKGALMRYYAALAPALLPAIADRPLVLQRFPHGLDGESFYQQQAPAKVPPGVRVEDVSNGAEGSSADRVRRFVGGELATLLHLVQLGAISVDPWHGRLAASDAVTDADYAIIDLDPGPDATFARVVGIARAVRRELDALGLRSVPKTSGATGLHVVVPLVPGTPADAARLLAELVAMRIVAAHPKEATVVRTVRRRPTDAVYVDYLQNVRGKTVAAVYSARARAGATVSTPLTWSEVTARLDPARFTIATVPARLARLGDLWGDAMRVPNDLTALAPSRETDPPDVETAPNVMPS